MLNRQSFITCLLLALSFQSQADEIRVAVASNFLPTLKQLATIFETKTGHIVSISSGSTGKHYAQIRHGAPFDILFCRRCKAPPTA